MAARAVGDIGLVIVDPVVNIVTGDSHKNTETRRALQPLVDLGAELDAAVLGVSHYTKGTQGRDPVERVVGSIAFSALPRLIFGAAKRELEDGSTERVFARAKSNIGPDGGGFRYSLEQHDLPGYPGMTASRVLWGDALEGSARELLAEAEAVRRGPEPEERLDAEAWLKEALGDGPVPAKDLQRMAKEAGHAWATIRRAYDELGIISEKEGFGKDGRWNWRLKDAHKDAQSPTPKKPEHLSPDISPVIRSEGVPGCVIRGFRDRGARRRT